MSDEAGYISQFTGQVLVPVVTPSAGQSEAECKHCGRTFYAKRSDARFCSANCRKASSRRASQIKREAARIRSMMDRLLKVAADDERLQIIAALEFDTIRSKCDTRRSDTYTDEHHKQQLERLYFAAIDAIRAIAEHCDEHHPNANIESTVANHYLNLIRRAAFDAESGGVFRRRVAGGLKNSSSPLDPEFDRQFESRKLPV